MSREHSKVADSPGKSDACEASTGFEDSCEPTDEQRLLAAVDEAGDVFAADMSSWFADTEERHRAAERLGEVISDWEAEHGTITEQELASARAHLSG